MNELTLISHHLCPFVQRAVISLTEKAVDFERLEVDLSNKPDWFKEMSPLGKTPVLKVGNSIIFESSVILEYLEETQPRALHPTDPVQRAEHRSWIEFGSSILNDIGGVYAAKDEPSFKSKVEILAEKFARLENRLAKGPYFAGNCFSLVDAAYGPIFRYFDVFEQIGDFGILSEKPKIAAWRIALHARHSIKTAVSHDYNHGLWHFLDARESYLSHVMADVEQPRVEMASELGVIPIRLKNDLSDGEDLFIG